MKAIYRSIDELNEWIGRSVAWLALFMVLVQFVVVLQRYVFGVGSIKMQESIVYMHGMLFMAAGAYTLLHNGHVRVDLIYRTASARVKAWTDLLGSLLLLIPVCLLIIWAAWPDVRLSWMIYEGSTESSGIHLKYILKSFMLIFPALLILQGISMSIKAALKLAGHDVHDPYFEEGGAH